MPVFDFLKAASDGDHGSTNDTVPQGTERSGLKMKTSKLGLDFEKVDAARAAASEIAASVMDFAAKRTTTSVERATLRMMGVEGADAEGVHWVNRVVDSPTGRDLLAHGLSVPFADAVARTGMDASETARAVAAGSVEMAMPSGEALEHAVAAAEPCRETVSDGSNPARQAPGILPNSGRRAPPALRHRGHRQHLRGRRSGQVAARPAHR